MEKQIRQRLVWVEMYSVCDDAGLVCRRCGISRPTLREWTTRFMWLKESKGLEIKADVLSTHQIPDLANTKSSGY